MGAISCVMSVIASLTWFRLLLDLFSSRNRILTLESVPGQENDLDYPLVSIIVPALNEEKTVGDAMRSLLELDYPRYEVIAVNDRSDDETGCILEEIKSQQLENAPVLKVIHVRELPEGWLGKNHALNLGSRIAAGDYLLFTDADVHYDPTALKRAVHFCLERKADHLTVIPCIELRQFWESAASSLLMTLFTLRFRPTHVDRPECRAYIGVGAFNMIRAEFYHKIKGHQTLRMEIIDDVKLGKLVKRNRGQQSCLKSGSLIRVRWAEGLRGLVQVLEKNAFASVNFNLIFLLSTLVFMFVIACWPIVGLLTGSPGIRLICLTTWLEMILLGAIIRQASETARGYGLLFPISMLIFIYIMLRSAVITLVNRGVTWRGTHYPLDQLKKGIY